jgi:uncharacterized repeat protein (TIGR02543 family)
MSLVFAATVTFAPVASAATITQTAPTTGATTTSDSATFADQLEPTTDPNQVLSDDVNYTTTSGSEPLVSTSGVVSTSGTLAAGNYTVSGTDQDTLLLDSGNWSYTLTVSAVTISQSAPLTGDATTADADSFTDQLQPTTFNGSTVSYATSVTNANLTVSPLGAVSASGTLAVGNYTVSGTDSDTLGDTGDWSYTLTVGGGSITQTAPLSNTTTTSASTAFTDQLEPTSDGGSAITYATSVTNANLKVSGTGAVTTSGGPLAAGPYTVSGTDSDTLGDSGTWSFTLTISGVTFNQTAPLSGDTTTDNAGTFTQQLQPTTVDGSAVTYTTTAANANLKVSTSGLLTTSGTLGPTAYTVSGTSLNGLGDSGTWTYTLTVSSPPPPSPTGVTLEQGPPTTGTTTSTASKSFSAGPLTATNNTGAVTFVTTSSNVSLNVSAAGAVTTTGTLAVGSYLVSGTDSDTAGDTGAWSYTLDVSAPDVAVTFVANGGTGTMPAESKNAPAALTPNVFTRAKYAFNNWNTAANGSGTTYGNGATYTFGVAVTLYAQWTKTSHPAVKHKVTFSANGGTGTMATQTDSVLATLKSNGFTRTHYNFNDWNTAANDSGASYANGAPYNFKKSITLYAQWTLKPKAMHKVSFKANGGTGAMAPETQNTPGHLSPNRFTRAGYTFVRWNTLANDSGASYVNHSAYNFKKSITLYAQWTLKPVVIVPPVDAVVILSPFANKSSVLSPALEAQITALAATVKKDHDTKIALVGFSGELTTANELNEEAWSASLKLALARAIAVETYLEQQLSDLGITGSLFSTSGSTKALPVSSASQPANRKVVASLT